MRCNEYAVQRRAADRRNPEFNVDWRRPSQHQRTRSQTRILRLSRYLAVNRISISYMLPLPISFAGANESLAQPYVGKSMLTLFAEGFFCPTIFCANRNQGRRCW